MITRLNFRGRGGVSKVLPKAKVLLFFEPSLSDIVIETECEYIPGPWRTPSLGRRVVNSVKKSPMLARKAIREGLKKNTTNLGFWLNLI